MLACRQMAAAAATLSDSSPPGCAMRTDSAAMAASAALTPCPSWPSAQAQGCGNFCWCRKPPSCELVTTMGTPSFSQGYAPPPFNWTDRGRVYKTGQKMKVPFGSYDDVLVMEEFDAEHSGTLQLKYYARGIGAIGVGARGEKGGSVEDLKLTKFQQLGEKELAEVRAKALELEKRGSMYPLPPMEHVPKGK